ncbi:MAG TPA: DinB family protein [Candidatus Eremiobacteraceae bacterium]|nr:DinB family protein [Candidatus Eremiobacteraceae bacterium]
MQPLSPSPLQAPISMLEKTPAVLQLLLGDLPEDVLEWKPAPERWSIAEVLEHMLMIEKLYEQRARRIVLEDSPVLPKSEAPEGQQRRGKTAGQSLDEFVPLRRAFTFYLHSIPSTAGGRTGHHAELGTVTLSQMLHELANHDLGHLRQVAELYRAHSFYPHGGPFQKYSNPKP